MVGVKHLRLRDVTGCIDHELLDHGRRGRIAVTDVEVERTVGAASIDDHVVQVTNGDDD